jgi:Fic-DOC domain mobile mystery protein B
MGPLGGAHAPGATPPDKDELAGIIPKHIATQQELNEYEEANILLGLEWAMTSRKDILSEDYVRQLHKRMFNKTWRWAGTFRNTEKSIGVDPAQIAVRLRDLLENVKAWQEFKSYPVDEQAVRLHHGLVWIHPFPNGNGRHARLFTDMFLKRCEHKPFTWGQTNLTNDSATRRAYIDALRAADNRDYAPLMAFVTS